MATRERQANVEGTGFEPEAGQTLTITRTFEAPRERVWQAWTDAEQVKRWWGPANFTADIRRMDFHVGGKYLFGMRAPDGEVFWSTGIYREIAPLERIVYTDSFADEEGNIVSPTRYGMSPDFPQETQVTVLLKDRDEETELTLTSTGIPAEEINLAQAGWNESFDKLEESLAVPEPFVR